MTSPLKIGQPRFISKDEVLTLHRASLDAYGGADGYLNEGSLDSALAQAQQGFGGQYAHEFPFGMAAAYGFHIAMNHAFRDGNKRTAFASMIAFLRVNGWNFELPDAEAANLMLELIEKRNNKLWLANQLQSFARQRPSLELRDFFQTVTGTRLLEAFRATVVVPKGPEFHASLDEAATVMPLLQDLQQQAGGAFMANDEDGLKRLGAQMALMMHLYRIAEDMGYEW